MGEREDPEQIRDHPYANKDGYWTHFTHDVMTELFSWWDEPEMVLLFWLSQEFDEHICRIRDALATVAGPVYEAALAHRGAVDTLGEDDPRTRELEAAHRAAAIAALDKLRAEQPELATFTVPAKDAYWDQYRNAAW